VRRVAANDRVRIVRERTFENDTAAKDLASVNESTERLNMSWNSRRSKNDMSTKEEILSSEERGFEDGSTSCGELNEPRLEVAWSSRRSRC
jgi:hypothetical protein